MTIAATLKRFLDDRGIAYQVMTHAPTSSAIETAAVTHVSGNRIAKAVLLTDDHDMFIMAVLPANHHLELRALCDRLGVKLRFAREAEMVKVLADCELGAIPAMGPAYGLRVVWDDALKSAGDVYFEGGDHMSLVRISGPDFMKIMGNAEHGVISHPL